MSDINVVHFREFYETLLGKRVAAWLVREVRYFFHNAQEETLLALGYPLPVLAEEQVCMVGMPAQMGGVYWPTTGANKVALVHEGDLPIREASIHRMLVMHALEHSDELPHFMREIERTLTPGGRVLLCVPNRLSVWSHSSKTPFGYGKPWTALQLKSLLNQYGLTFVRSASCLYLPPSHSRFWLKLFDAIEWIGKIFLPSAGGVLLIEAQKQIYAGISQPVRHVRPLKSRLGVSQGLATHKEAGE